MLKYCFITDQEKGLVQLGAGCSDEYYQEIGMEKRDVEQSDKDNQWYLSEKCPHKTEEEKTAERKANFENNFLELDTNKNYRLEPKGYSNAQQSIDVVDRQVQKRGALTSEIATMVLFYETPDFTKPEQCTEEWLIQHQYSIDPMSKENWDLVYDDFTLKYAQKMYQQELRALNIQIDYTKYTVVQLKAMANERGISYPSNILKADLISLLENN